MPALRIMLRYLFLIVCFMLPNASSSFAQTDPNLEIGLRPFGSYEGGNIDVVSLTNGNVYISKLLFDYPQRGNQHVQVSLRYNNKMFQVHQYCDPHTGTCSSFWYRTGSGVGVIFDFGNSIIVSQTIVGGVTYISAVTPDGSSHQMGLRSSPGIFESVDGSGIWYDNVNKLVRDRYGNLTTYGSNGITLQDANGNLLSQTGSPRTYTDTLGRNLTPTSSSSDNSGCTGPLPITSSSISTWPAPSGQTRMIKQCNVTLSLSTHFNQQDVNGVAIREYTGSVAFLQSVVLYNGISWTTSPAWTFQYSSDGYGDLTSITFPTGGTITYSWATYALCSASLTPVSRGILQRTVNATDGTGPKTTNYSVNVYVSGIGNATVATDPVGNDSIHGISSIGGACSLYETQTRFYQGPYSTGTLLKTVTTNYSGMVSPFTSGTGINVYPIRITTTWPNGQVSKIEYDYDSNLTISPPRGGTTTISYGNAIETREYDYGSGAPGPLLRRTDTTYQAFSNSSYLSANFLNLVSSITVYNGSGTQVARTTYGYDTGALQASNITTQHTSVSTPRGNRTSVSRWLNGTATSTTNCPISVSNGYLVSYNVYFDTGTVQKATDSCGTSAGDPNHTTTFAYSSNYAGAWPTTVTNALSQSASQSYDFNTGAVTSRTDSNNQTTNYKYSDSLGRLTEVDYPDLGVTKNFYTDTPLAMTVETQRQIDSTRWTDSFVLYNGLAHPIVHSAANDEAIPWDRSDTCYDALGRVQFSSYPYQGSSATSAPNCSGTGDSFAYDGLGRVTQLTHSDGNSVLTTYTSRATQVQDEGNGTRRVTRISQVDGLGRLASVCEVTSASQLGAGGTPGACGQDISATGFLTTYGYDTLGNLTSAAQSGLNTRTFQYDSLSHITSASNPESGTTSYAYDADGNLITKTDARGITATYSYDFLNRIIAKTYSDPTPSVGFLYDVASTNGVSILNPVGRLVRTTAGSCVQTINSYDKMGRIATQWLNTPIYCGPASFIPSYGYDLAGDMTSLTNGVGITFSYTVNRATRVTTMASNLVDSNHPGTLFSAAHYNAASSLVSASLGNVISETRTYGPRLRLASIADGSNYSLTIPSSGGYAPNDDILAANDSVNGNWTYSYDDFNRLSGSNQNSGQAVYSYAYDRFGNRWQQNGPHTMMLTFSGANNHMDGYSYDAAGNLLSDGTHNYAYDAENRIKQVDGGSTAAYFYDANGQRVQKTSSSGSVSYLYDLAGHEISEVSSGGVPNRDEIYAGERHVATYISNTTYFIHPDWLGTERARSNVSGGLCETISSLPFGDWQSSSGSCGDPSPMHFTGKERDSESGLDEFGARYYSSALGRFTIPDWAANATAVPYADFGNPQSLNLYSYVKNNPLGTTDPDGHCDPGPACSLQLLQAVQNFADHPGEYVKAFVWGAVKQQLADTRVAIGLKKPEPVLNPSNDVERLGAGMLGATKETAAVVLPLLDGGKGGLVEEPGGSFMGPKEGSSGGPGAGKDFSPATKQAAVDENAAANGGSARCVYCGDQPTNEPGPNKVNIDHVTAKANDGNNTLENAQVTCQYCNGSKGTSPAPKNPKTKPH